MAKPLSREDLDDYLCRNYCDKTEYGAHACSQGPNGPILCEGRYCEENYNYYLDAVAEGTEDNVAEEEEACDCCGQLCLPSMLEEVENPSDGDVVRVCPKCIKEAD